MITVMGATGRIGRRITGLLREQGQEVRGIGRSAMNAPWRRRSPW